jgi:hypothetical protein
MNTTKLQWLRKLARSTNFIVVTDKESVISVKSVQPRSFKTLAQLSAQRSSLLAFKRGLDKVIVQFDKEVDEHMAVPTNGKPKKVTKISVKNG